MDSVNRKMAIDMLVRISMVYEGCRINDHQMVAARRSIGRQFILITPGSRSEISLAPDVRVKEQVPSHDHVPLMRFCLLICDGRLAEPERGQRQLSFR